MRNADAKVYLLFIVGCYLLMCFQLAWFIVSCAVCFGCLLWVAGVFVRFHLPAVGLVAAHLWIFAAFVLQLGVWRNRSDSIDILSWQ